MLTARVGGLVYSATQGILDYYGVSEASASMRDAGGIPVNYGKLGAKEYYTTISTAQGGYDAFYLYSATNVRLQELALNYTFPKKWFNDKLNLTLGIVGRNLAMIYCKAPFDPELSAAQATTTIRELTISCFQAPGISVSMLNSSSKNEEYYEQNN